MGEVGDKKDGAACRRGDEDIASYDSRTSVSLSIVADDDAAASDSADSNGDNCAAGGGGGGVVGNGVGGGGVGGGGAIGVVGSGVGGGGVGGVGADNDSGVVGAHNVGADAEADADATNAAADVADCAADVVGVVLGVVHKEEADADKEDGEDEEEDAARDEAHAETLSDATRLFEEKQAALRAKHETALESATRKLWLEKDRGHNSDLVAALRARDAEHVRAIEAHEERMAALEGHEEQIGEQHAQVVADAKLKHESDVAAAVASAVEAASIERDRLHAVKVAQALRDRDAAHSVDFEESVRRYEEHLDLLRLRHEAALASATASASASARAENDMQRRSLESGHATKLREALAAQEAELRARHAAELEERESAHRRALNSVEESRLEYEAVHVASARDFEAELQRKSNEHRATLAEQAAQHEVLLCLALVEKEAANRDSLAETETKPLSLVESQRNEARSELDSTRQADVEAKTKREVLAAHAANVERHKEQRGLEVERLSAEHAVKVASVELEKEREATKLLRSSLDERDREHAAALEVALTRAAGDKAAVLASHKLELEELEAAPARQQRTLAKTLKGEMASATQLLDLEMDRAHGAELVSALIARDEEHAKAVETREQQWKAREASALDEQRGQHENAHSEGSERHREHQTALKRKDEAEIAAAQESVENEKDRLLGETNRQREEACSQERRRLEEDLNGNHRFELSESLETAATSADEKLREKESTLRAKHNAELESTKEMLMLEKDRSHNSELVATHRARDDEHAKLLDALEKEHAERHARGGLEEQRAASKAQHDAELADATAAHEEQLQALQRKLQAELALATDTVKREKDLHHFERLAEAGRVHSERLADV
ncbi:hypothetical protein CTAYLR_010453, partial [Chrysophaeum taylorii]